MASNQALMQPNAGGIKQMQMKDLMDGGISYGTFRPINLNQANINESYKPISAPYQGSTNSLVSLYNSESQRYATVEANTFPWYFHHTGDIPYGTAQQSNPNVEVPSSSASIAGDDGNTMLKYPRVYYDYHNGNNPHQFASWNNSLQGEPTEFLEMHVPREDQFKARMNPMGPGGWLQQLWGARNAQEQEILGMNRSRNFADPYSGQ